jgi:hypothetical protein
MSQKRILLLYLTSYRKKFEKDKVAYKKWQYFKYYYPIRETLSLQFTQSKFGGFCDELSRDSEDGEELCGQHHVQERGLLQ